MRNKRICLILVCFLLCLMFSACQSNSTEMPEQEFEPADQVSESPTPEETIVVSSTPDIVQTSPTLEVTKDPVPSTNPSEQVSVSKPPASVSPENTDKPSTTEQPSPEVITTPEPEETPQETITLTVSVPGSTLLSTTIAYEEGMSAFDALRTGCNDAGISISTSGSGASVYVRGIGSYLEFSQGPGSGWLYFVNGSSPSKGCGSYLLQAGDSVKFSYTTNYGQDLQ